MRKTRLKKFAGVQLRCGLALNTCLVMGPAPAQALATAPAPASTPHPRGLAPVLDGVTLLRLAEIAETVSLAWSEPRPWDVRAALGSERAANALTGTARLAQLAPPTRALAVSGQSYLIK